MIELGDKMNRVFNALKYIVATFVFYVRSIVFKPISIKNVDDSIEYILSSDKSVARFGDGEIALIKGKSLRFQDYSDSIRIDLISVLSAKSSDIIVAIPDNMTCKAIKQYRKAEKSAWIRESMHSYSVYRKYCKDKNYITSLISRLYLPYDCDYTVAARRFKRIRQLWDKKSVLIVEGRFSGLGVGNDLFDNALSINRILCPEKNAYFYISIIEDEIKKAYKNFNYDLIILALGPTATIIPYHLKDMARVIDLGHIDIEYEWYLKKATDKIAISGKAVNEAKDGYDKLGIQDVKYKKEIIKVIE